MIRLCVCGRPIKPNKRLCANCLRKYGQDPHQWDEWLNKWLENYQHELNQDRRHLELALPNDEYFDENTAGSKQERRGNAYDFDPNNFSSDDYIYPQPPQGLSHEDMAILYPGSFFDNLDTRSIYDKKEFDELDPKEQSAAIWDQDESASGYEIPTLAERENLENKIFIDQILEAISDREREVISLFLEGYSLTEIGEMQGVTPQMISKIFNRVVKRFRNGSKIQEDMTK